MNQILFIGYDAWHPQDFVYSYPDNQSSYLLLLTDSPATFLVDGELRDCPAGTAILYAPGQQIYYSACSAPYKNDWIRFSSDEGFVSSFPLKGIPFSVSDPEYCHSLFRLLTWESNLSAANSELIIENLLRVLFQKLHEDSVNTPESPHAADLLRLHKQILNAPQEDWSVTSMARQVHLSPGYLQLIYKQTFGTSCMEDVIEGRIRLAKEQLIYSSKSVSEIAEFCGYRNTEHFCRQFRKFTQKTPGSFRKAAGNHSTP